jgi:hypothetical protein
VIENTNENLDLPIRFSISHDELTFSARFWLPVCAQRDFAIALFLGIQGGDYLWMNTNTSYWGDTEKEFVSVMRDAEGYVISGKYPWEVLPPILGDLAEFPAVLQVITLQANPVNGPVMVDPSITIPLLCRLA